MRHRPGTSRGVVFLTVEDEFGVGNLVVFAAIAERDRQALLSARLLLAEGKVERVTEHVEVPVNHLIVQRLIDRSDLLDGLNQAEQGGEWAERALGRADEVRRPEPGSRSPVLPRTRDFQ